MKKTISILLIALILVGTLTACGNNGTATDDTLSVVTTIFPEYDWVMNILGDRADSCDVTMLLDKGVDLHSYQPTADDIIRISTCDIFIYVGGESDEWVEDALKETVNKDMRVINLLDVLGEAAKAEELKDGMEAEEEEEEEGEAEYDEHVWLSLKNAVTLVEAICNAITDADAENAEEYSANAAAYVEKLKALDGKYETAVGNAPVKTLLFVDRFPFRYMTDDYGLDYFAAFLGCSAESEASFETVAFLADKVDELKLSCVLTLEGSDGKIAETVVASTESKSAKILSVNSMQSVTAEDVKNGASYLTIMEKNLDVLTEALR